MVQHGTVLYLYYTVYTFTDTEECTLTFTEVMKHRSGLPYSDKHAHKLTHTLLHIHTHTYTHIHIHIHTHTVPAQIKLCYNNPIWDGLDFHSESTHIMMLWWVPVWECVFETEREGMEGTLCVMGYKLFYILNPHPCPHTRAHTHTHTHTRRVKYRSCGGVFLTLTACAFAEGLKGRMVNQVNNSQ